MQAFFIFIVIFCSIFGAVVFIRIVYNAIINRIIKKRRERKLGGQ